MALLREILVMTDRTIWLLDTFEGFPDGQEDRLLGTDTPVRSVQFAKGLSLDNRIGRKESRLRQRRNERIGKCE
jgi:hypothetical protein